MCVHFFAKAAKLVLLLPWVSDNRKFSSLSSRARDISALSYWGLLFPWKQQNSWWSRTTCVYCAILNFANSLTDQSNIINTHLATLNCLHHDIVILLILNIPNGCEYKLYDMTTDNKISWWRGWVGGVSKFLFCVSY